MTFRNAIKALQVLRVWPAPDQATPYLDRAIRKLGDGDTVHRRNSESAKAFCARIIRDFKASGRLDVTIRDMSRTIVMIWDGEPALSTAPGISDAVLSYLAGDPAPSVLRSAYRAVLRHGAPGDPIASRFAGELRRQSPGWLDRVKSLPGDWLLLDRWPDQLAQALLRSDISRQQISEALGLSGELASGRLMQSIFAAYASGIVNAPHALREQSVGSLLDWAFEGAGRRFPAADGALVEGALGVFATGPDPSLPLQERLIRLFLKEFGDPRVNRAQWPGQEPSAGERVLTRWLTQRAVHAFLDVIDRSLHDPDDKRMWRSRREFWTQYLPHIEAAWPIFSRPATEQARRMRDLGGFGVLEDPQRSALMMDIRSRSHPQTVLRIVEWSSNGKCRFWLLPREQGSAPRLFGRQYLPHTLMGAPEELVHWGDTPGTWDHGWQREFQDKIYKETKIFAQPPGRG